MHTLFFDTNIMLDLLGERKPYYTPTAKIATLAENNKVKIFISPIASATVSYFISKFETSEIAIKKLRKFKVISQTATIDDMIIEKALNSDFKDFEDALQYYCALESKCDIIISRNPKDFKKSSLPIMSAHEYLKSLSN